MSNSFYTLLLNSLYPGIVTRVPVTSKSVFLTFDDGPHPEITTWVLNQLNKVNAQATFFCCGKNAEAYPEVMRQILAAGHTIGNHGYNHMRGFTTDNRKYYADIERAAPYTSGTLYRPPYGQITLPQFLYLRNRYRIILWDVLSYDYDTTKTHGECLRQSTKNTKPGSVVVMHDSVKAFGRLEKLLPALLEYYSREKYIFEKL